MSDISVGHEEMNIACTIVLLKRAVEAGVVPKPLAVELSLGSGEGWRRAAIEHLDNTSKPRPTTSKPSVDWQEVNEELDWEDRRERAR
jgi:hypothetical protein